MQALTNNTSIQNDIEQNSLVLHEKVQRLPNDSYWRKYKEPKRKLKTQEGFHQKVTQIKEKYKLNWEPEILPIQQCSLNYQDVPIETLKPPLSP